VQRDELARERDDAQREQREVPDQLHITESKRVVSSARISDFTLEPKGPFTLASAARFIAGWPPGRAHTSDGEVRLHFLVDDWSGPARVVLRQEGDLVTGTVEADNKARAIEQAARIVSLDHDGTGYPAVSERDPIVKELQERSGYLRPVLFHSPYEAAAWSVISARANHAQAVRLRDALGETFPAPQQLLRLKDGLPANKLSRLHGIARAALEGKLDREPLLAKDPNDAYTELQELPGIGPFYAGLILVRAVGTTDVAPKGEPRLEKAVEERYGKPIAEVGDGWRPFRTWVSVLIRASA
jgi:DNA-3-methyladenine glycosylase II